MPDIVSDSTKISPFNLHTASGDRHHYNFFLDGKTEQELVKKLARESGKNSESCSVSTTQILKISIKILSYLFSQARKQI